MTVSIISKDEFLDIQMFLLNMPCISSSEVENRVDVNAILGVGGDVGYGGDVNQESKNRRYCTMYKKVLYNIKKIKKMCGGGGGEGPYLNPKHYVFKKEKETRGPMVL